MGCHLGVSGSNGNLLTLPPLAKVRPLGFLKKFRILVKILTTRPFAFDTKNSKYRDTPKGAHRPKDALNGPIPLLDQVVPNRRPSHHGEHGSNVDYLAR